MYDDGCKYRLKSLRKALLAFGAAGKTRYFKDPPMPKYRSADLGICYLPARKCNDETRNTASRVKLILNRLFLVSGLYI